MPRPAGVAAARIRVGKAAPRIGTAFPRPSRRPWEAPPAFFVTHRLNPPTGRKASPSAAKFRRVVRMFGTGVPLLSTCVRFLRLPEPTSVPITPGAAGLRRLSTLSPANYRYLSVLNYRYVSQKARGRIGPSVTESPWVASPKARGQLPHSTNLPTGTRRETTGGGLFRSVSPTSSDSTRAAGYWA